MEKNTVVVNKKTASNTKILEVNGDIIVPDIKPDIVNVINTNGIAYICKKDITTGRIRVDGNIDTYIVYLADNGETRSIQTTLTFSENIEENSISEKCFSKENIILDTIESKVLNERKLSIKANVRIRTEVYETSEVEITSKLDEFEGVQQLKEKFEINSVIGINKTKTSIKENISVDGNYKVAEILKTDVEITNLENKISYNKVLAKADCNVKIIFLSEEGNIGVTSATIPVMSFIDLQNITDQNTCNVEYYIRNMLFKANSSEMNSINCQIDFDVQCEAFENKTVEVIQDLYGIRSNVDFTRRDVEVQVNSQAHFERVNINEKILVEDILNIYDVKCTPKTVNTSRSGNFITYECELNLNVYYEADNRNGLNVKTFTLPFMVKFEGADGDLDFNIVNKQFSINNENVDCNVEISVRKNNNDMKRINIIEDVKCSDMEEDSEYKMYMYFVKSGDTLWKIAKKFRVNMDDIISINKIEEPNKINVGDRLYIMR